MCYISTQSSNVCSNEPGRRSDCDCFVRNFDFGNFIGDDLVLFVYGVVHIIR